MAKVPKRLKKGYSYMEQQQLLRLRFTYEGQRFAVYGNSEKECERKKEELVKTKKNNSLPAMYKMTVAEYYNAVWIKEIEKTVKQQTLQTYAVWWGRISNHVGKMKISKIQKADVINLQSKLLEQGASIASINASIKFLKRILKAAVIDRIITFNPCEGIKPIKDNKPKAVDTIHRALTPEETTIFFEYAKNSIYFYLFKFLLETGARVSEALALTWDDIDRERKEIKINKVATIINGYTTTSDEKRKQNDTINRNYRKHSNKARRAK